MFECVWIVISVGVSGVRKLYQKGNYCFSRKRGLGKNSIFWMSQILNSNKWKKTNQELHSGQSEIILYLHLFKIFLVSISYKRQGNKFFTRKLEMMKKICYINDTICFIPKYGPYTFRKIKDLLSFTNIIDFFLGYFEDF